MGSDKMSMSWDRSTGFSDLLLVMWAACGCCGLQDEQLGMACYTAPYKCDSVRVSPAPELTALVHQVEVPCCFLCARVKGGSVRMPSQMVEALAESRLRSMLLGAGFQTLAREEEGEILEILALQKSDLFDTEHAMEAYAGIGNMKRAHLLVTLDLNLRQSDEYNWPVVDYWYSSLAELKMIQPSKAVHVLVCSVCGFETEKQVRFESAVALILGVMEEVFSKEIAEARRGMGFARG